MKKPTREGKQRGCTSKRRYASEGDALDAARIVGVERQRKPTVARSAGSGISRRVEFSLPTSRASLRPASGVTAIKRRRVVLRPPEAGRRPALLRTGGAFAFAAIVSTVGRLKTYVFEAELWLARPRPEVFQFFGDAANLQAITPPWVHFEVLTPPPIKMHPGTIIDYRIKLHGFPMRWRTEIAAWDPPFRFVDEQIRGPYRFWRHTHTFEEKDGGTLCRDHVEYAVLGGALVERLFVRGDVKKIFAYRQEAMQRLLGGK